MRDGSSNDYGRSRFIPFYRLQTMHVLTQKWMAAGVRSRVPEKELGHLHSQGAS